jgi:hypothetical protein
MPEQGVGAKQAGLRNAGHYAATCTGRPRTPRIVSIDAPAFVDGKSWHQPKIISSIKHFL